MDKYEYREKSEKMLEYAEKKQYQEAMEIADQIEWKRVKSVLMLSSVSEIYERNGEYAKSRQVLKYAYDRQPGSRKLAYRLSNLALKDNDLEKASDYYEEFVKIAPKDPNQYILKYKILKAQDGDIQEQIESLKEFKEAEYVEKWAYELATLYHKAGMTAECIEECDDLMLWFSDGKYVYRAMELKMLYKPLTPVQQIKYEARPGAPEKEKVVEEQKADAFVAEIIEEAPATEEVVEEAPAIEEAAEVLTADEKAEEELADAIVTLLADEIAEEVPAEISAADEAGRSEENEENQILDEKTRRIPDDVVRLMSELENDMREDAASVEEEKEPEAELVEAELEEADFEEADFEEEQLTAEEESVDDALLDLESALAKVSSSEDSDFSELEIVFDSTDDLNEASLLEVDAVEAANAEKDTVEAADEEAADVEKETVEVANVEADVIEAAQEAELEEADFEEADFEEADFEEADFEEAELEEAEAEDKACETTELDEEEFDEEELSLEDEMESIDRALEALGADEHTEAEIRRRKNSSTGKVPFDTGFVVTGRYDLSATSEIGLRAGLNEEQKKLFSYFVPVRGMSEQIVDVLDNDKIVRREGTSKTGNLMVIGGKGSGKTALAIDIVKAIQKQRNLQQGKMAIIDGESLSKKDMTVIFSKLHGGALIIENAGTLSRKAVIDMNLLMERKTGELLIVLEDQEDSMKRLLATNPEFKKKFTSKLVLPVFVNDELVTFGQTYAKENGCKLDEMGILALYSKIDVLQREDHAVTVAEVKEIMDEAIEHSKRANVKHLARRVFGKRKDDKNRVILSEEDFQI